MYKRLIILLAAASAALAQSTVKDALVKHWNTSKSFTLAVANLMPAADYAYKPVAEELSFGQVLLQVGVANLSACANASGMKRPAVAPNILDGMNGKAAVDKDTVVQFLGSSFDFCNQAV